MKQSSLSPSSIDIPSSQAQPAPPVRSDTAEIKDVSNRWKSALQNVEWTGWKSALLELLAVSGLVLLFCWAILDLRAPTRLPGNETEVFQSLDWVLVNGLKIYRQFPLWNPQIHTGIPYIADPMLHVYNPFVTIPVLSLGVNAGYKLAVFLSFLFAAWGMLRLGAILGMNRPARMWMALMFAFSGQPAARFFQGQYLFVLGFAWIPWIMAYLILASRTRRRRHIALTVVFLSLLFFSGNAYYPFYMLVTVILFGLVMVVHYQPRFPFVKLDTRLSLLYLTIAILTLGVIAVQLLPLVEFWPRLNKDLTLSGSHTLRQIFLDYVSKDTYRPDAYGILPAREEFYAYIGLTPFIGLILLPIAYRSFSRRLMVFLAILIAFVVLWIGLEYLPWRDLFLDSKPFIQFRHLLRILIFGSFALIVLAGMGLDAAWKHLLNLVEANGSWQLVMVSYLARGSLVTLMVLMAIGVLDLFSTNREIIRTQDIFQPAYNVMRYIRDHDLSDYYVRNDSPNSWHGAVVSSNLRFIDAWYHFVDIRDLEDASYPYMLTARPKYIAQPESLELPVESGSRLVHRLEGYDIYLLPGSLPMAFMVAKSELIEREFGDTLTSADVKPLSPFFQGPNDVEVIAEGYIDQTLVVLMTHYPGWLVKVDGVSRPLKNIAGYMGVDVLPGVHKYAFSFRPRIFYFGLLISLVSMSGTLYLLLRDLPFGREDLTARWRGFVDWWEKLIAIPSRVFVRPGLKVGAIYVGGVLQPTSSLEIPENSKLQITIEQSDMRSRWVFLRWFWANVEFIRSLARIIPLDTALFAFAITLYLSTRLISLTEFPIYFFSDEAVQTVLAADFVRDDLKNYEDELLPTYFKNVDKYNLSISVYVQVLPYMLFGKSAYVTRVVSVLFTLIAVVSVSLILRNIFNFPYWWSGALLLSIIPTWFLHSRTAFETVLMVSFYAGGLYFYMLYRYKSTGYLYTSLVLFGLAFYSYSPGQLIVAVTGLLLLISDFGYHWHNRSKGLKGLILLTIISLPYVRFRINHASALEDHLSALGSYWISPLPVVEKLGNFSREYLYGLSPAYWFFPNGRDLVRHLMKGYGHIHWTLLPFIALGVVLALKNIRSSAYRAVLIALLAAPTAAALVHIAITRVLVMVVPAALLAAIGLVAVFTWIERASVSRQVLSVGLFAILSLANLWMMRDALRNSPTWYDDFGLGGMQYGGAQLFSAVEEFIRENPSTHLVVSPSWANGADIIARFFLPEDSTIILGSIDDYLNSQLPLNEEFYFVMTPDEYERAEESGKFSDIQVARTLPYPDGRIGFYFVNLKYVDNIQEILASEREARKQLIEDHVIIDGQEVALKHSLLDMGQIADLWDQNPRSVARTFEANPFIIQMDFPEARLLNGFSMVISDADISVTAHIYSSNDFDPLEYARELNGTLQNPQLNFEFGEPVLVKILHLEVEDLRQGDPGHVHIWEIKFY